MSRGAIASSFMLVGYLLVVAYSIFMPKVEAVLALLCKACAFVGRVLCNIAEFAKERGWLCRGSPTCWP
jgi:hypothetical protein